MTKRMIVPRALAIALLMSGVLVQAHYGQQSASTGAGDQRSTYTPLGYYELRAFEQSFPETPMHPVFRQASSAKYWAFRGVAYRGFAPASGGVWTTLGPET